MTRLEVILALIVVILAGLLSLVLYERHEGAQACLQADAAAVAKQIAKNTETAVHDSQEVLNEKAQLAAAQLQPVDVPVVRLCRYTPQSGTVLAPGPAGSAPDGKTAGTAEDLRSAVSGHGGPVGVLQSGPDVAKPLVTIGRDSDAQVSELQAYIKNVCLASP